MSCNRDRFIQPQSSPATNNDARFIYGVRCSNKTEFLGGENSLSTLLVNTVHVSHSVDDTYLFITPPEERALWKAVVLFVSPHLYLPDRKAPPASNYISGCVIDWTWNIAFAQSLPHFTRGEKSEIWRRFSTPNPVRVIRVSKWNIISET